MDELVKNYTPLNLAKKNNKKKLLIINLLILIFFIGIVSYYLQKNFFTYNSLAGCGKRDTDYACKVAARRKWREAVLTGKQLEKTPGHKPCTPGTDIGCIVGGVGGTPSAHYSVCANGAANAYCNENLNKKGKRDYIAYNNSNPTTPPEATPTSTPIETPTATLIPFFSPTPTDTPIITLTATPLPTNTPESLPTPTEIILAKATTTITSTLIDTATSLPTKVTVSSILQTGMTSWSMLLLPIIIIIGGLII